MNRPGLVQAQKSTKARTPEAQQLSEIVVDIREDLQEIRDGLKEIQNNLQNDRNNKDLQTNRRKWDES